MSEDNKPSLCLSWQTIEQGLIKTLITDLIVHHWQTIPVHLNVKSLKFERKKKLDIKTALTLVLKSEKVQTKAVMAKKN